MISDDFTGSKVTSIYFTVKFIIALDIEYLNCKDFSVISESITWLFHLKCANANNFITNKIIKLHEF